MRSRLSRRRALAATGAGAVGAAFLAACGGGDDSDDTAVNTGPKDTSGLVYSLVDETKSVKRGGMYIDSHPLVLVTRDPMKTGGQIRVARRGYSQLFRITDGHLQPTSDGTVEGDLAESWELSPDKLTLTLKLDGGAGLPQIAPVNGRTMDADDVIFSFNRMKSEAALRSEYLNELNPAAPILSLTSPDKKTVVIKMSAPLATIFPALGTDVLGTLYILPKEATGEGANSFDPVRKAIGSGPYYMTEDSETLYAWKKNSNFKRSKLKDGQPYIDEIREPVIPDAANATAQFRAGAIYEYNIAPTDLLQTKKDLSQLVMRATPWSTFNERLFFGQGQGSIFKDERARIALMKTLDRDAFISAAYNSDKFAAAGLPVEPRWEGSIYGGSYEGWWLDPKDTKAFGDAQKNYNYDLTAAKQMLEAASLKTPVEFDMTYGAPAPTSFPPFYYTRAEIFLGMIESSGIWKMARKLIAYQTEWSTERYRFSKGNFTGMTWGPDTSGVESALGQFFVLNSKGGYFMGGDSTLDDLTNKARAEFDDKKRIDLVHQIQKYDATKMYSEKIGIASGFALAWPALRNMLVNTGGTNWMDITTPSGLHAFIDPEQAPLKKT